MGGGLSSDAFRYGNGGGAGGGTGGAERVGTARFRGYGEEEGGYDDVEEGAFARRAKEAAAKGETEAEAVGDLLGGEGEGEADDDDGFDPRAGAGAGDVSDMADDLVSIGLGDDCGGAPAHAGGANAGMQAETGPAKGTTLSTSELVLQLAAQKRADKMQVQPVPAGGGGASGADLFVEGNAGAGEVKRVIVTKKDSDPFGDLVSTAKQSGVL